MRRRCGRTRSGGDGWPGCSGGGISGGPDEPGTLAYQPLEADKVYSRARQQGLITEDEADNFTAVLTELDSVVHEAQSRVMGRPYNSLEVAGLV